MKLYHFKACCGFLSGAAFLMQRPSYLFSFVNIPLPFNAAFSFPVSGDSVRWQHSSNIPKYTNTQACLAVRGICFHSGSPPNEHRCYFSSHPVKPACALYCAPYCFSAITLRPLLIRNVSGNMNMLTNRYRICPLMCMTMGDPTWAFVLAATEIWHLTVQLLTCRPSKIPLSALSPQPSVEMCARNTQFTGKQVINTDW